MLVSSFYLKHTDIKLFLESNKVEDNCKQASEQSLFPMSMLAIAVITVWYTEQSKIYIKFYKKVWAIVLHTVVVLLVVYYDFLINQ